MQIISKLLCIAVLLATLVKCKKDDSETDPDMGKTFTVVLDVHNDILNWRYFSFKEGAEVNVVNYSDTLNWDLGIHYENFRTNGGKSGSGQGAVLDLGAFSFNDLTIDIIAGQTFTEDDSISVLASMAMPPVMMKTPGSVIMEDMFQTPQGPPPHTYTPNNHVYVIRTSKGKHIKLIGKSFFNDLGEEGYFNFKYAFLD